MRLVITKTPHLGFMCSAGLGTTPVFTTKPSQSLINPSNNNITISSCTGTQKYQSVPVTDMRVSTIDCPVTIVTSVLPLFCLHPNAHDNVCPINFTILLPINTTGQESLNQHPHHQPSPPGRRLQFYVTRGLQHQSSVSI